MADNRMRATADKLVAYCRENNTEQGLNELYDPNAVSVEASVMPGESSAEIHGVEGIRGKHQWWQSNFEVHSASVDGPYPHGDDRFAVIFEMDTTHKESGQRSQMKEVAVYIVNSDAKIVREEFYYSM